MKHSVSKFLSAALLCNVAASTLYADKCCSDSSSSNSGVITAFTPRSQGRNKVIQVVGTAGHQHFDDRGPWHGDLDVTFEFAKSFHDQHITSCFFGPALVTTTTPVTTTDCKDKCKDSCDQKLLIQGCAVAGRDTSKALAAGNFFLPEDFSSEVTISPEIKNFNVHLGFYMGLDQWLCNSYFRIHGPIAHTRWKMGISEKVVAPGSDIGAGVLTPGGDDGTVVLARASTYANFSEFIAGDRDLGTIDTVKFNRLTAGRISSCEQSKTGFADLRFELGWNYLPCDDSHIGINIQAVAPTGTKRNADYLFAPIIGNDKAELGLGLTAHYTFWRNESEDVSLSFWLDGSFTHLFNSRENRVFDLKGKPLSRYMMASKFTTPVVDLNGDDLAVIDAQFAREFAPVANLTARDVDVSIKWQSDVVLWFNATWCSWSFDLGYNYWGRSCEKIKENCKCPNDALTANKWALRGNSQMFGFEDATPGIPLSATQSKATIFSCLNAPSEDDDAGVGVTLNDQIDNAALAFNVSTGLTNIADDGEDIFTSVQPIFIAPGDVDYGSGARGSSHKLFAHVNYAWERECWTPYLGFGAAGEWGSKGKHCGTTTAAAASTSSSCDSSGCGTCSLSQWSVWVKLGVSFN